MAFDHEAIRAAFENKPLIQRCPACGATEWDGGPLFVLPIIQQPGGEPALATYSEAAEQTDEELKLPGVPIAPRTCISCGYMQLFYVPTLLEE